MDKYKVTYQDGTEEVVEGQLYVGEAWTTFSDGNGARVTIRTSGIYRIDRQ